MSALPFTQIYLVPVIIIAGYLLGGWCEFITPLFVFGIMPILDYIIGPYKKNAPEDQEKSLSEKREFRWITWACVPMQVGLMVWGAYVATHKELRWFELVGFVFSVGIMSGVMGINISHELIHRIQYPFERFLGNIMLWTTGYMHWAIEHVQGHHKNVATPLDPATAKLGESFWAFWPRTVFGGFQSAWKIEARRMERMGKKIWSPSNRIIRYTASQALLALGLAYLFGFGAILFYIAQGIIAFSLLEVVNYLEHYGLERRKIGENRYEPVTPLHAWNTSFRLTNYFLINLQRHSGHHAQPQRRYQILRHFDESPQLPLGYAGMVPIALIAPLWRRIMDHRVLEYRSQLAQRGL